MTDHFSDFQIFLLKTKKCSDSTFQSYLHDVRKFLDFCKTKRLKDTAEAKEKHIKDYLTLIENQGLSKSTQMRVLASLRCYYLFLNKTGITDNNPITSIRAVSAPKKLPEVLTTKEIGLLLEQPNGTDFKSCRDKAMLEIMYATGIKVSELVDLTLSDVNLSVGILHLHTVKNERIIPIYPAALKTLMHYVSDIRPSVVFDNNEERLFTNMMGQPLSRQGFWKIVKSYAQKANIKKDITPHTFRHSFATHLLENGADLNDIKEMLGHSDISTTNVYAQLVKNKYALSYKKFHPLAK